MRAIGPSAPVGGALPNPQLDIYDGSGQLLGSNDNWQDAPNRLEIIASTIPPTHPLESAFLDLFPPGNYTAVVSGVNGGTGIGVVEAYDLDGSVDSQLANIATRGLVKTSDDVMIGGLIVVGDGPLKVIVRALGPSLPVEGKLLDPSLELYDGNGVLLQSNDNWRDTQQAEIETTTIPPPNNSESAVVTFLNPAAYTAIVRGVNDSTGVGLVEVYALP